MVSHLRQGIRGNVAPASLLWEPWAMDIAGLVIPAPADTMDAHQRRLENEAKGLWVSRDRGANRLPTRWTSGQ